MNIDIPDNLLADNAPVQLTESIRVAKIEEVLNRYADHKTPEQILALSDEPRVKAEIEAETFLVTAQLEGCADRALTYQAVRMAESGLCHYAPDEAEIEEHLHNLLDMAHIGGSTWYNLRTLVRVVIPWAKSNGKTELLGSLWQEGVIAKTRIFADRAGQFFATQADDPQAEEKAAQETLPTQTFDMVTSMLEDLGDQSIPVHLYAEKYPAPTTPSGMATIQAYNYLNGKGSIIVLLCPERGQVAYVENALKKKAQWIAGEGREEFLGSLVTKK